MPRIKLFFFASAVAISAGIASGAAAQTTDNGGPGKALTSGTISSNDGAIADGGANQGVTVQPGANDTVSVMSAQVNNASFGVKPALLVSDSNAIAGVLQLDFTGASSLTVPSGTSPSIVINSSSDAVHLNGANALIFGNVSIETSNPTSDIAVSLASLTTDGSGNPSTALSASTNGGAIDLAIGRIQASTPGNGILATVNSGQGGITISTGNISGAGIGAQTTNGSIAINIAGDVDGSVSGFTQGTNDITITGHSTGGLFASTGGGHISLDFNGFVVDRGASGSVDSPSVTTRNSGTGVTDILVDVAAGTDAETTGTGTINIGSQARRITGGPANGAAIFASGGGDINVYAGADSASGGGAGSLAANGTTLGITPTSSVVIYAASTGGSVVIDDTGGISGAQKGIIGQADTGDLLINTGAVQALDRGIEADTAGGAITINATGGVSVGGSNAIFASNVGDGGITVNSVGDIAAASNGIAAQGRNGAILINQTGSITEGSVNSGHQTGIFAQMSSGATAPVTINQTGDIRLPVGSQAVGILVSNGGSGTTTVTDTGAINGGAIGVQVAGDSGVANVVTNGAIDSATFGVLVTSTASVNYTLSGGSVSGGTGVNLSAKNVSASSATGSQIIGTTGDGLTVTGNHNLTLAGDVTGRTNGISAIGQSVMDLSGAVIGLNGIGVSITNASAAVVKTTGSIVGGNGAGISLVNDFNADITTSGSVTGEGGSAIDIHAQAGVSLSLAGSVTSIGQSTAGVSVTSQHGPVTVVSSATIVGGGTGISIAPSPQFPLVFNGPVSVVSSGSVTGLTADGIDLEGNLETSLVTSGAVIGAHTGIALFSNGFGSTSLTTGALVSGGSTGINAISGSGGLSLSLNADVTSTAGPAVLASSLVTAKISIGPGATISGAPTSGNAAALNLITVRGGVISSIDVGANALVRSDTGNTSDLVIRVSGDGAQFALNNSGTIIGSLDLSGLTGSAGSTVTTASKSAIVTSGTSIFSNGDDNFVNAGLLVTGTSLTMFDFAGGTNVFTNSGAISLGFNPILLTGSSLQILRLATFNNSGLITMQNGVVGDSVAIPGAAFVGSGASRLAVDTIVGAPGSRSDTLTVGTSSGRTSVLIHDASAAGSFGALNTQGTVIVAGTTHAGDFVLDAGSSYYNPTVFGGAIDKPGLFFSQLAVNPASQATVLISAPKVQAFQFATLPTQVQSLWYDSAPKTERMGDLRDALSGPSDGQAKPGLWLKLNFATTERDTTQTYHIGGNIYGYDAGYSQDATSALAGYDDIYNGGGSAIAYGVSTGYVGSKVDFDQAGSRTLLNGWTVEGYATLVRGDLFVTGTVGGDFLKAKLKAPQLNGYTPQKTDVTSLGGSFEVGLREPVAGGAILEPSVAMAYVHSSIDDLAAAGANFHFDDPESLRFSVGVRMSGAAGGFSFQEWRARYNLSLRVVSDFLASNKSTVTNAGPSLPIIDNLQKQFVEANFGFSSHNHNGWTASATVSDRFNTNYNDLGLNLGLRLRF